MDPLKAEIERKRSASAALSGTAVGGKKKWVKKGDLKKAQAEEEKARQASSDAPVDAEPPVVDGTDSVVALVRYFRGFERVFFDKDRLY